MIIDAQMPLMNGYELLSWLIKQKALRHIPLVVWTGAIAQPEVIRFYQTGANTVMLKQDALADVVAFCYHWFKLVQLPITVQD